MKSITCIHCKKIGVFDTPTGDFCIECWNQMERLTRDLIIQTHNIYLDAPDWSKEYTSEEYRRFERKKKRMNRFTKQKELIL